MKLDYLISNNNLSVLNTKTETIQNSKQKGFQER